MLIVAIFVLYGSLGYVYLENLKFSDALLRTLLVFSTLGFSEATTQSEIGKWFTIFLIMVGVGVIVYVTTSFVRAVIEGEVSGSWKRHMTDRKLAKIRDHVIVCGFGQVGRQVAEEMAAEEVTVVVIDKEDRSEECHKKGYLFIQGDGASSDELWHKAHITVARAAIIAIGNDGECLSAAVTARALSDNLYIVARATSKEAESRLLRVGVNRVALPAVIGGYHMATMALRPSVVDFVDLLLDSKRDELQIEELEIEPHSSLINHKVLDFFHQRKNGIVPLALYRAHSKRCLRPNRDTEILVGDKLILMGTLHQLDTFFDRVAETR